MFQVKEKCDAMGVSIPEYFAIRRLIEMANGRQVDEETRLRAIATVNRRFPGLEPVSIPTFIEYGRQHAEHQPLRMDHDDEPSVVWRTGCSK